MSGFCAVNAIPLAVPEPPSSRPGDEITVTTPTTPRATRFTFPDPASAVVEIDEATVKTPTKESFASIGSQLPPKVEAAAPISHSRTDSKLELSRAGVSREGSHRSTKSLDSGTNSPDLDMKRELDEGLASDNESVNSESGPPSKKKKGQRFFCTDFPPCQLSFTRSEHLARHIRKHTGERPFQCHCGRRFSRLDNLRQHAQTVHVNEDIPTESLAATGTRFQRQIRTDRIRPPASRSRASTFSSQGSFTRGHSRNLSASSITSVSTTSSISDDIRSRPSSLIENSARSRLSIETFNPAATGNMNIAQYYAVGGSSPNGYSTSKLAGNNSSPRFSSAFQSPTSVPRNILWAGQPAGRRLSVPSSNPFQAPFGHSYSASNITPLSSFAPSVASGQSSLYASPTSSTFDGSRRGSIAAAAVEEEIRRRTWHPSTRSGVENQRPGTTGLGVYQTAETARSVSPQKRHSHQTSITRLPGIESFDHAPPKTSIVRPPSPMEVDQPARPALVPSLSERRIAALPVRRHQHNVSWDTALHRGLTKLELNSTAPPPLPQPAWQYTPSGPEILMSRQGTTPNPAFQAQPSSMHAPTSAPQAVQPPPPANGERVRFGDETPVFQHRSKRHAWYNGPIREHVAEMGGGPGPVQITQHTEHVRTSSDDSASSEGVATPSSAHLSTFLPSVVHHSSYSSHEPHHQQQQQHHHLPALHELAESKVAFSSGPGPTIIEREIVPLRSAPAVQHALMSSRPPSWPLPPLMEQPASHPSHTTQQPSDMRRLEALVAVATGESGR